jgi:hypothetical protein
VNDERRVRVVNWTPLRLVAIEESPLTEDEHSPSANAERSGAPISMMMEENAITRRVPEADMIASMAAPAPPQRRTPSLKLLLSGSAVAVVVAVAVIALALKGKGTATPAPSRAVTAPVASPAESPQARPSAEPTASATPSSPRIKVASETIRLTVTAEPMEAELSLDGNVLAGHRLNLEVPKDRGIHVVSASAPGHVPFNQQVSFSNDVVLKISLRRAHTPPARQVARARPSQVEPSPRSSVKPASVPSGPGLAPGMWEHAR